MRGRNTLLALALLLCAPSDLSSNRGVNTQADRPLWTVAPASREHKAQASASKPKQMILTQPPQRRADVASREADVVAAELPFAFDAIQQVNDEGHVTLATPSGQVTLTLVKSSINTETTTLRLLSSQAPQDADTLPSTITYRAGYFFATIATPTEVYRVVGDADGSRWIAHRALAQRWSGGVLDYQHASS